MPKPQNLDCLFEVSWEVCNKVGGIHTVVSSKAKTLVEDFGDSYVTIGPWLLSHEASRLPFEDSPGFERFAKACRAAGTPVRVGRWLIPGMPRTILVEFSNFYDKKDAILAGLWERFQVDSLYGGWDYVEPLLFGHACGIVIEKWYEEYVPAYSGRAVAQFHEWMTGAGILYLKQKAPTIGTIFTSHATVLGRAMAAVGENLDGEFGGKDAQALALEFGVRAKHSLEHCNAREADVFTTVSEVTAAEAEQLLSRRPTPILPNGIDLEVVDAITGETPTDKVRQGLSDLALRVLGDEVEDAAHICISGRYEFHNKGIDLLLDALGRLNTREGRKIIAWILVPAGASGHCQQLLERLDRPPKAADGPIGLSTHNLFDPDDDPVQQLCRKLGIQNQPGSRVKVIQVPDYLGPNDGLMGESHESVLRGMELTCFPSFYEPWGYTPEESLAAGVPTITSDHAGFGRWVRSEEIGPDQGVYVLSRLGRTYEESTEDLAGIIEEHLALRRDAEEVRKVCRATAQRTSWAGLIRHYYEAYEQAARAAALRPSRPGVAKARRKLSVPIRPMQHGVRPNMTTFDVAATLPDSLAGLKRLAWNYWWCWDPEARSLFRDLSPKRWQASHYSPVHFLRRVYRTDLEEKANDEAYLSRLSRVLERLDAYLQEKPQDCSLPGPGGASVSAEHPIAYFCAEFGIHESLRIYSGGLGLLAGDHLKSASDLNLPLLGVGLFYSRGYMQQRLTSDGEQISLPAENIPRNLPIELLKDEDGKPLEIELRLPSSKLVLRAYQVKVGRVTLYLLDSNVEANSQEDRQITGELYGGDLEMRLRQEIVLGRGGFLLLRRLGISPAVYHMNEGHAAFLALERVNHLIHEHGLTFEEAHEFVRATTAFTTHTPVPAGHDRFGEDLMRRYFSDAPSWVGLPWDRFFALGESEEERGIFNMTLLALSFSRFRNGVSQIHRDVSQELFQAYWARLLKQEIPIDGITNGVHLASWIAPEIAQLMGATEWAITPRDYDDHASEINLHGLWKARQQTKERLLAAARENLEESFLRRQDSPLTLREMVAGLEDPNALVIGFARRFAPYKRADLIFRDPERLTALLGDEERPVRILFAGKAHPRDGYGQEILRSITQLCREERFIGKVFFLTNYNISLARDLVRGVDVWLNNPIRPKEASGTSGMKAAANGCLNLSISDGWWEEAYNGSNGWVIGNEMTLENREMQDDFDSADLYRLLEEEVVPLYFKRDEHNLPIEWLQRVRDTLVTIPTVFNTDRMVTEYFERAYRPLGQNFFQLSGGRFQETRKSSRALEGTRSRFNKMRILSARISDLQDIHVGDTIAVHMDVDLGSLSAEEVVAELVVLNSREREDRQSLVVVPLTIANGYEGDHTAYEGAYTIDRGGSLAYGLRVRAVLESSPEGHHGDLILWA